MKLTIKDIKLTIKGYKIDNKGDTLKDNPRVYFKDYW